MESNGDNLSPAPIKIIKKRIGSTIIPNKIASSNTSVGTFLVESKNTRLKI